MSAGRERRLAAALSFLIAAAVLLSFSPVRHNGFLEYDDDRFITANPLVRSGLGLAGAARALTSLDELNWHPLAWVAWQADWSLLGDRPGAHHLVSVLWHALAAVLFFLALRRMTGRTWPPAFAAALFALHPLRVESVAWAAELKDPLAGCLLGATLLAYARHAERPGPGRLALVAAFAGLGLMAKPSLVPLPLLLLVLDFWPLGRRGWRILAEKAPVALLACGAAFLTYRAQVRGGAAGLPFSVLPLGARVENAVVSTAAYLGKLLWPAKLAVFYPHPATTIPGAKVAAAALLLVALAGLAAARVRRNPYLAAGLLWFLVTLLPVSGVVQASIQGMADRFTYLPLAGIGVAIAWGAADLAAALRVPRAATAAAAALLLAGLGAATWATCGFWRDDTTLFEHALAVTERNPVALFKVGVARQRAGRYDEAIDLLNRSLAIRPATSLSQHYYLGNAYRGKGMLREAVAHYRAALVDSGGGAPEIYNDLGAALAETGDLAGAEVNLRRALLLRPGYPEAASNLELVHRLRREGAR